MQSIYNYKPETHRVSKVCSVAAVLYLQFVLHVMLFRMLNVFCTFTTTTTTNNNNNTPSYRGTRWRSWLRHCATNRKIASSIPVGVTGIFH